MWNEKFPWLGILNPSLTVKPDGVSLKPTNQHETLIHQEEPEDLMDTSSLSVEDIKIKKEQERANCYGFDVRTLIDEEEKNILL